MASSQYPILRKLVTGVPSPTSGEPAARWSRQPPPPPPSTSTGNPLQPATAMKQQQPQTALGSVRDRARAYEQRYAAPGANGPTANARSMVANNVRIAKSSAGSQKRTSRVFTIICMKS